MFGHQILLSKRSLDCNHSNLFEHLAKASNTRLSCTAHPFFAIKPTVTISTSIPRAHFKLHNTLVGAEANLYLGHRNVHWNVTLSPSDWKARRS